MKTRALLLVLGLLTILTGVLVGRAAMMSPPPPAPTLEAAAALDGAGAAAAAERLAGALRFRTTSEGGFIQPATIAAGPEDLQAQNTFEQLLAYLKTSYPKTHERLTLERIGAKGILYTWKGSGDAEPLILVGHLDVVPSGKRGRWAKPPFGGVIEDGFVWGRGALDDKAACLAILEATEGLLTAEFAPARTVYLAFGLDEEIGGQGAQAIAARLKEKGVRAHLILDEGLAVTEGVIKGLDRPVALVGIAEKRYFTVELLATAPGGHSSMPGPRTAIGKLGEAIARIEAHPMPASLEGPAGALLDTIGPEMPFGQRLGLANRWLLGPILEGKLDAQPGTNALIRTTTAPTLLEAGVKENVLPTEAKATVNFRIRPGDTGLTVLEHLRVLTEDLEIELIPLGEPDEAEMPVSPTSGEAYDTLRGSIQAVFPEALVAPSLVLATTDARHYTGLSESVYRFLPWRLEASDLERIHGFDERVAVANYAEGIRFYGTLIRHAAGE